MTSVTLVTIRNESLSYALGELVLQSPRLCAVRLHGPADPSWYPGMSIVLVVHGSEPTGTLGVVKALPSEDGILSLTPVEPMP